MKYVALLRGIGPGDPRMTNDKLRGVFESLGFKELQSLISSGNIIFSSDKTPDESTIEQAIEDQLGFFRPIVIRNQDEIASLIALNPYGESAHSQQFYTLVTFLKKPVDTLPFGIPLESMDNHFKIIHYDKKTQALFSITDHTAVKTPKVMTWLEKNLSKDITSRTWNTIERINSKF